MAIEANELRIGNLVLAGNMHEVNYGNGPYKHEIREVCCIDLDIDDEYEEYIEHVEIRGRNDSLADLCNNISPIPLTEEWLVKFGFEESVGGVFTKGILDLERLLANDPRWEVCVRENQIAKVILYVHRLQNLYYALTGEELQLNSI